MRQISSGEASRAVSGDGAKSGIVDGHNKPRDASPDLSAAKIKLEELRRKRKYQKNSDVEAPRQEISGSRGSLGSQSGEETPTKKRKGTFDQSSSLAGIFLLPNKETSSARRKR